MKKKVAEKIYNFFSKQKRLTYKKGEIIIHPGDNPTHMYYIKEGYVRKYCISKKGDEMTDYIHLESTFFPITKVVDAFPNNYYYEAATPVEIFVAPQEDFFLFINKDAEILFELLNFYVDRTYALLKTIRYLMLGNSYYKVLAILLYLAILFGEKKGNSLVIKYYFTHEKIAAISSISRETVSKEIKKIIEKGLARYEDRCVVINDVDKVKEELNSLI